MCVCVCVCVGGGGASLNDVLAFFSGASAIPPLGFDANPSLHFDEDALYPTASTCVLRLTLPSHFNSYSEFKDKMTVALLTHGGFGTI